MSLTIHAFSTGGKDTPHDVELSFSEIKLNPMYMR